MEVKGHIHFIGICGVAMSALAIAFKKNGWAVTGSDKGFYPPVSDNLHRAEISFYPGWHPERMGTPDLVVVGNVAGSKNPEWLTVQEKKIPYSSYPEVIREYVIRKHSVVCAGTYGKSTSSALLAWILTHAGMDPSYMFGGVMQEDAMPPAAIAESAWSVVEGDEYKTARWDEKAKFFHYAPTHLLLTSVVWDHADVYPTPESYRQAFLDLVRMLPSGGLLVLSAKVVHDYPEFQSAASCRVVTYGKRNENEYQYGDISLSDAGVSFTVNHELKTCGLRSAIIGDYMADNATGCFALCREIGIPEETIQRSLASFPGMKRRMEIRRRGDVTVIDDIAHSPKKAEAILRSIRAVTPGRVFAVFEPNTGNRQVQALPGYDEAFRDADTVVIPRLSAVKRDTGKLMPVEGDELAAAMARTHTDVRYIPDDEMLVRFLRDNAAKGDAIAFLGSHGFRGMIERVV